jgi:hypothetical protein
MEMLFSSPAISTALIGYVFEEGEAVETWSVSNAQLHIGIVTDGIWPRAVAFAKVADAESLSTDWLDQAAGHILDMVGAPARWRLDLAMFLTDTLHFASAGTWIGTLHGDVRARLQAGRYTEPVWDVVTGRRLEMSAMEPRAKAYAASVANLGDVELGTRFASTAYFLRTPEDDPALAAAGELITLGKYGVPILDIQAEYQHFGVTREYTPRSWLTQHAEANLGADELEAGLARELREAFFPEDHYQRFWPAIQTRSAELVAAYRTETVWMNPRRG